jgi:translation initiation factor 2B subunit (eIF-2B alpha/beta/delta family)
MPYANIRELAEDRIHGAAWLTRRAIEILQSLSADERRTATLEIAAAQPSMASLFNLANRVLVTGTLPNVSELEQAMNDAVSQSCMLLRNVNAVLTHSRSGTVERALSQLRCRVICTESQPGGEGLALANSLQAQGCEALCVRDGDVQSKLDECDAVLVGADAISPAVLVNKVGTSPIAAEAKRPFYVVCTLDKLIPRASAASDLFDETPLDLITAVISEQGPLTPGEVRRHIESFHVHPDLRHLL